MCCRSAVCLLPSAFCFLPSDLISALLLPRPENLQRINVTPGALRTLCQLRLQLCGCTHLEILILHGERCRREGNCPIDCFQALPEQILIVVNAPPTFPVERVGDIKLCLWVTLGWVSALPLVARGAELLAPKER